MAIISAGVTMNLVFGFAAFVFVYMTHGEERQPATVGYVEPGSPAWKKGVQDGHVIYQIGNEHRPYFDSLMTVVMESRQDEALPFVYGWPGARPVETTIVPTRENEQLRPMIGVGPPPELQLPPSRDRRSHELPVQYNSAAAKAEPPFEFGDRIVATTDPDRPTRVTELRDDPRHPGWPDYFQFKRRMQQLAGKHVVIRVRRGGDGQAATMQDIKLPPATHYTLGLRMRMGKITAIRTDSPAQDRVEKYDIIERVEVNDPRHKGGRIRYVMSRGPKASVPKNVTEELLDPVRLPSELEQWARTEGADGRVTLGLLRKRPPPEDSAKPNHKEDQHVDVTLRWDRHWRFDDARPLVPTAPLPIAGLGLAYQVETRVADVVPRSPAARAGIQKDDVIKAYRFQVAGEKAPQGDDQGKPDDWTEIKPEQPDQWAFIFHVLQQRVEIKQITLRLEREDKEITLVAEQDKTWPLADRGLLLELDSRLVKADSFAQATGMGVHRTYDFIKQIFGNLRGVITNRLSYKNFGGPVMIAKVAFFAAAEDPYKFLLFLAIISVNLAVINFLPIPVLDGGHMVFLIYESVFRRPAPERVLTYALIFGLTLLVFLMGFVTYLDLGGR
jgi:regulator of sigma E protease